MKVLKSDIEKRIVSTSYHHVPGTTTTTASIKLNNGYVATGTSAAVDPALFNHEIGKNAAYEDAFRQLYAPMAFLLLEAKFQDACAKTFGAALKALKTGKRVKRAGYTDELFLCDEGHIHAAVVGGIVTVGALDNSHLLAEDWEVVK